MDRNKRRRLHSWLAVGALFVFCGILGFLQYRWIGEVSVAERERLRASLQATLTRLSLDFNSEITAACRALLPLGSDPAAENVESDISNRYQQWKKTTRHTGLFRGIALAEWQHQSLQLKRLDPDTGLFQPAEWPLAWAPVRERIEARLNRGGRESGSPPGPPPEFGMSRPEDFSTLDVPFVTMPSRHLPQGRFGHREPEWLVFDFNPEYLRDVLLAEVLQRYLGTAGNMEYQVWVLTRSQPPAIVFRTDPAPEKLKTASADASINLFELQYDQMFRHGSNAGPRRPLSGRGPGPGPGPGFGRWQLSVRHRSGSLEAVVDRARTRNLAVTAGVLLLMMAAIGALIRFTRQSQKLAELQMEFVAGVSHELRTPLTVIHTAAYNLRGPVAANPGQVERYGALIQQESGRLKELVEQVLRFAGTQAGHVIQDPEPIPIGQVVEESLESTKSVVETARCVVEKKIEAGLPLVLGDRLALKQAVQNLVENAAKYGAEGGRWIGMTVSKTNGTNPAMVEIAVADRGPGIPADEQKRIFDPFFRGRRALQEQIRGTGLGLNLVKKIVEAHGGTIRVISEPMKGAVFTVRIPAAPEGGTR